MADEGAASRARSPEYSMAAGCSTEERMKMRNHSVVAILVWLFGIAVLFAALCTGIANSHSGHNAPGAHNHNDWIVLGAAGIGTAVWDWAKRKARR